MRRCLERAARELEQAADGLAGRLQQLRPDWKRMHRSALRTIGSPSATAAR